MTSAPSVSDPLGYDALIDETDLDPTGRSATGEELALAEAVHRITCESIPMIGAPDGEVSFGINVRKWVGEAVVQADLDAKIPLIDEAIQRSDRVRSVNAVLTFAAPGTRFPPSSDGTPGAAVDLVLSLTLTLATGATVTRILGINSITAAFLAGA